MEADNAATAPASEEKVVIVVRSPDPARLKDLRLTVPLRWHVKELKWLVSAEHPLKPSPSEQVLIYGGKVLTDAEAPLARVLRHTGTDEGPYTMHLAVRSEEQLTQSVSAPNLAEMPRATPASTSATETAPPQNTGAAQSPMMAVPVVMVNPVMSAAYNAALAAVYNPEMEGRAPVRSSAEVPRLQPATRQDQPAASSSNAPQTAPQPQVQNPQQQQQPLVPAIALFPLGIPVLVPAAAAQNEGFQAGQTAAMPVQTQRPAPMPQQRAPQRRPAQAAGRRHANAPPARGRGVVVYRFTLRGLVQMALIVAVLYAYCSQEHFIVGLVVFVFLYLFARPLRRWIHTFYNARDANGNPRRRGWIHDILAVVLTLISSLLPNWNVNEGQGVPFARVVREGAPEENRIVAQNRPHAD